MRTFLLSICLWTLTAAAQVAAPASEAQGAADAGVSLAPSGMAEPAKPADATAPAKTEAPSPPPAAKEAPPLFRIYGMIKPTIIGSGSALESYGNPNDSAVTAAGNPVIANQPDKGRLTFQIGQSRLGFHVGEGTPYHAQIEMDFLDFAAKASPTVASVPRIRIARLDWKPSDAFTITAGQDWDLTQPVNPHGVNFVGALFQSGNSAFMRQQVKFLYGGGPGEVGLAVGLQNNNNTNKDGAVELGLTPTLAARMQLNLGKGAKLGKIGASGIATALTYKSGTEQTTRAFAGLGGIYADITLPAINIRAEGYVGRNAANIYMLTIGMGRAGTGTTQIDVDEAGGFVSLRVPINMVAIYGMFGGAAVLNGSDVIPSYAYSGTPATAATVGANGPGMKWNMSGRLGIDVRIYKTLSFLFEGVWLRTNHVLLAQDAGKGAIAQAFGFETGLLLAF